MIKRLTAISASTILFVSVMPRKAQANPTAIPAAAACIASVTCVIGVVVVSGVVYWVITENGRRQQVPIGTAMPVIDDPDAAVQTWDDYVWAEDEAAARQKCQAIAEAEFNRGNVVRLVNVRRLSRSSKRFRCDFEGEA